MPTPTEPNPKTDPAVTDPKADKPLPEKSYAAQFLRSVIGAEPKPPEPKKTEGGEPKPKPAPKKKPAAPPPAQVIDEEKLGASIGRSIAAHTARTPETPPPAKEEPAPASAEDDLRAAVLVRMEALNSEKYKGISERFKAGEAKLRDRAQQWEKANPGENFADRLEAFEQDPDAYPEFADDAKFATDLETESEYSDADFKKAERELLKEELHREIKREVEGDLGERVSEIERGKLRETKTQEINAVAYAARNDCLQRLGDEFAEAVTEDGRLNTDTLLALKEADPVKHDIGVAAMHASEQGVAIIHMLANSLDRHNPRNSAHVQLAEFAREQERVVLSRPADKQVNDDGLIFASRDDYERMTPDQKRKHFVFSVDDLKMLWVTDVTRRAKADLQAEDEKFSRRAKARGLITDDGNAVVRPLRRPEPLRRPTDDDADLSEPGDSGKPVSPSFNQSPKLSGGRSGGKGGNQNAAARFIADVFA